MHAQSLNACLTLQLCAEAYQHPLSMGFCRQRILEWVAISFSRDLPDRGIKPESPAAWGGFFTHRPPGKPVIKWPKVVQYKSSITQLQITIFFSNKWKRQKGGFVWYSAILKWGFETIAKATMYMIQWPHAWAYIRKTLIKKIRASNLHSSTVYNKMVQKQPK